MERLSWNERLYQLLFVIALLGTWEVFTYAFKFPKYILPAPSDIWTYASRNPLVLLRHGAATGIESVVGLLIGVLSGFSIAILVHCSRTARRTLFPLIVWTESIPKLAMAPLLVLWLGFGTSSKIALVVLISIFPILVNTVKGLKAVPTQVAELCHIIRFSRFRYLREIEIPFSLPHFFSGAKVAATLSVIGAVVGEFIGSDRGLGFLILSANVEMNTASIFACLVLLGIMGLSLFKAVELIERRLLPWYDAETRGRHAED